MVEDKKAPEIRFDGFVKPWEKFALGDVISMASRPIEMDDDTTYQCVTAKRRNEGIVSRGFFKGSDILVKSQYRIKSGDYIISKRQVVHGANGIAPDELDDAIVSNEYLVFQDSENMNVRFLAIISKLPAMYRAFFLSSYGVHIEKLLFDFEDWKKRNIYLPKTNEQQMITNFFHALDDAITLKKQQHEKTVNIKKAMLEKMFPKNGSDAPEIRFEGFTEAWHVQKLGDVVEFHRGLTYKPEDVTEYGVRVLRSSNINEDIFELHEDDVFVNKKAVNIDYIQHGDILITAANGSPKLVGKHAIISEAPANTVHGGFMLIARTERPNFINAWMGSFEYKVGLQLVQGGAGSIGNLSKAILDNCLISLPPKNDEQAAIGNFFRNLDTLIEAQREELEKLQNIKKACLNKMFV